VRDLDLFLLELMVIAQMGAFGRLWITSSARAGGRERGDVIVATLAGRLKPVAPAQERVRAPQRCRWRTPVRAGTGGETMAA